MTGVVGDALPPGSADVLIECRPLIEGFAAAGHRLYLVGGIVRDLYHGARLDELDLDFTTDAVPRTVRAILEPIADALWTQGERFGTIAAKVDGRLVEITTHRAEAYDPESRKPEVVFADDILVDLSRRDFTINALAIELTAAEPQLIDPFGGVGDLRRRRLRTPLAPSESFSDDPLRMLRAARFAARLAVVPDRDVVDAIAAMTDRLTVVSAERIRDELTKLLAVADPTPGLRLLVDTRLADRFLPELDERSLAAVTLVRADPILRLAVILSGAPEREARARMRALRHSRHDTARVAAVVGSVAIVVAHGDDWSEPDLRRLAHRAGADLQDVVAVAAARGAVGVDVALNDLATREDLSDLGVPIDGQAVMEVLGVPPGRDVGAALDHLLQVRLDEGPMDRSEALAILGAWWSERRP